MKFPQFTFRSAVKVLLIASAVGSAHAQSDWRGDAYSAYKAIKEGPFSNVSGMSYSASRITQFNGQLEVSTGRDRAGSDWLGQGVIRNYSPNGDGTFVDTPFQTFVGSNAASALGSLSMRAFAQGPAPSRVGSVFGDFTAQTQYSTGWTDYLTVSGLTAPGTLTIRSVMLAPHVGNSQTNPLFDSLFAQFGVLQLNGVGTANLKGSSGFGTYVSLDPVGGLRLMNPVCGLNCSYSVSGDRFDITMTFNVANGDGFRLNSLLEGTAGVSYYSNNAWLQASSWIESIELSSPGTVTSLGGGGLLAGGNLPYGSPVSAVPEPSRFALLAAGVAFMVGVSRRRRASR